jgi:Xaa-Pro aminopeptidase
LSHTFPSSGAIIHYKPERGSCAIIDPNAIYLCDSGGQYLDGTTDTTRTLHFGTPTPEQKKAYTLVLKGNIALDTAVFPKGTTGFAIDCLARQFLWVSYKRNSHISQQDTTADSPCQQNRKKAWTTATAQATA